MPFARFKSRRSAFVPAWSPAAAALGISLAISPPASALQPLGDFLTTARTQSLDNRAAVELATQRSAEVDQAWGRILPAFTARGAYTRNQYPVEINLGPGVTATITPANQLDATFTIDVPLVDVAAWKRIGAASALSDATDARVTATALEIERVVAARYYQVVAAESLVDAAGRTLKAAEESQRVVLLRREAGAATEIDLERAQAEIERARQALADAELLRAVSRQALGSLSGLAPSPGAQPLEVDLTDEAPLASWLGTDLGTLPSVRAAELEAKAQDRAADAAKAALLPTIAATATERITNASGFSGNNASYTAGLVALWRLDYATISGVRAQNAAARGAVLREESAKTAARDRIHDAWQAVRAQIAKSRAARAQSKAATHAAALARDRYAQGAGTQLELIQAERDAFGAEVLRVQADADLALARGLLRLSAGRPLGPPTEAR